MQKRELSKLKCENCNKSTDNGRIIKPKFIEEWDYRDKIFVCPDCINKV